MLISHKTFPIRTSWIFSLCLTLVSCLPDPLEVNDIPEAKQEVVVATQMLPDQSVLVWLTRTFGALEVSEDSNPEEVLEQIVVDEAMVSITGPGGTEALDFVDQGVYRGEFPFKAGETYELNISTESLGELKASTRVQGQVKFESVKIGLYSDIYDDTLVEARYLFQDPPEKNWYMLNVQKVEGEGFPQNTINPQYFTKLFDDTEFNGGYFQEEFSFYTDSYEPGDTITISLANISEEYYQFMKLRSENRSSYFEFLSEPVNYPTNVAGGKGFFNLHLPDVKVYILEMKE